MQKLAAYRLERHDGMNWLEIRQAEASAIKEHVKMWLAEKGATPGAVGSFRPEDLGTGSFQITDAEDGDRSWWMARLDERSPEGTHVTTSISVTVLLSMVALYVTLEAGTKKGGYAPVEVDVRCPRVVRKLVETLGPWRHGHSSLRQRYVVNGFDQGEGFARELLNPQRSVPYVVVTRTQDGGLALPQVDEKLEYDLAGIANVAVLDANATWAIGDVLGRLYACFDGAVRVYWPGLQVADADDPFRHRRWTPARLRMLGPDPKAARGRFALSCVR